jgi:hypothetical protein
MGWDNPIPWDTFEKTVIPWDGMGLWPNPVGWDGMKFSSHEIFLFFF